MALNPSFAALCAQAGVPDEFTAWLVAEDVLDSDTYASLSALESGVAESITSAYITKDRVFPSMGKRATPVKLWRLCRAAMTSSTSKPGESAEDTPLDPSIAVDLKGTFSLMHQIVLPDSMLLVPTLQNKIYWDIVKSQPVITPLLLESIRTMSSSDRPTAQVLKYTPGKAIVGAEVIIDAVDGYGEVYERTEAWFYTVAFCSAGNPAFFDMQSALMCSKNIW